MSRRNRVACIYGLTGNKVLPRSALDLAGDIVVRGVKGDDDPEAVPNVRDWFEHWADAAGARRTLSAFGLPDRAGCYVLAAAVAPA